MKFITVALLFLLTIPGMAAAPERNETLHLDSPIDGVVRDCGDREEPVALVGFVHGVVHRTWAANGYQFSVEILVGPRGDAKAIGLISGRQYNLVGQTVTRLMFGVNTLESFTYINNFNIPGLYDVHYTYRLQLNNPEDGYENPRAFVDKLEVRCR